MLNTLVTISDTVAMTGAWIEVDLTKRNTVYITAVKGTAVSPIKSSSNIKKINCDIAVDSGVADTLITINSIVLDFATNTSESTTNHAAAICKLVDMPDKFYFRVRSIENADFSSVYAATANTDEYAVELYALPVDKFVVNVTEA